MERPSLTPLDIARFWSKVDVGHERDCWRWKSQLASNGYGEFKLRNRTVKAHRIAYFLMHGCSLAPDEIVMHACDVRDCINPLHLRLGSTLDNRADCIIKARHARGSKQYAAKLTEEQALDIRFSPMLARDLAAKYGIGKDCVYAIRGGRSWRHLPLRPKSKAT